MTRPNRNADDDEKSSGPDFLGFYVKSRVQHLFTVYLDEPVAGPQYYRNVINMMTDASEDDVIQFMVNNHGGRLSGLTSLIEALAFTKAHTVAVLTGETHSSASIFTLHCDTVQVLDSATMLCHNANYGTGGKANDIAAQVAHNTRMIRNLVNRTYKDFLTEEEIEQMLAGKDFWFEADEIRSRFASKVEGRVRDAEALEVETAPPKPPLRKIRKALA